MSKLIGFILFVLLIAGIAYYFLVYKKQPVSIITNTNGNPIIPSPLPISAGPKSLLNPGDKVYNNISYPSNDLYIYSYPSAPPSGAYIVGIHHRDWSTVNPIGTFIEKVGNTGFAKIKVDNLQIYVYSAVTGLKKISGDYFVSEKAISKTPY